ncbi:MAG: calmodulin [Pseudomonadota bacterium]|nr:calmodulin [Pseudomonadota bacterium]
MKKLVLALSLLGFATSPALAATMNFESVDADGDGQVTLTEATSAGFEWSAEQFAAADIDNSGGLSKDEFTAVAG